MNDLHAAIAAALADKPWPCPTRTALDVLEGKQ